MAAPDQFGAERQGQGPWSVMCCGGIGIPYKVLHKRQSQELRSAIERHAAAGDQYWTRAWCAALGFSGG